MPTLDQWLTALAFVALLSSGLIAGVFFAFSAFVMRALARLPAEHGMAAMRAINVAVLNPLFLTPFMGTAALSALAIVAAVIRWDRPGSAWLLAGGLLYLVGTFGVTVARNVPLNDRLAAVSPPDPNVPAAWADYVRRWAQWNHVRTITAVGAMAAFVMAVARA